MLVVGLAFPGKAYAYVAFPPGYTWDDFNSDWEDFDQKLKDRISHLWKDIGDGFSGSGGGDIEGGSSNPVYTGELVFIPLVNRLAPHEDTGALSITHIAVPKATFDSFYSDAMAIGYSVLARVCGNRDRPYVSVLAYAPDGIEFTDQSHGYCIYWVGMYELRYIQPRQYSAGDIVEENGMRYVVMPESSGKITVHNSYDSGNTVYKYTIVGEVVEPTSPEPSEPVTHEHPEYPVNDTHPDGSGDTYTYNVYDGDDVAFTVEVQGTDLSPITLRLDDLNLMFSDFANEFNWFEDTLLSLLMRIFTMQLYIYDEIADLLDGLETLDHSTEDLADLSTIELYLEDILSAVTNFADEDTGVTLMRGYLKGIFDDFGQLLQLLGDWPEYPTVEPSTVTVEPTDLDPVLTELRKIEDLLKGTGVKAPVAEPGESDPEKTMGMRIGEKMDELKDRFPFSLPWDIFAILNLLRADPVAPQFDLPVLGSDESVHVDLSVWESVAVVTRGGTTILFALGLALRSRSLLASWGGVSGD